MPALTEFLYLHDNRLTELPRSLARLTRLRYLNVGENDLTELPEALGAMAGLVELRAQHNRLTALPDSIGRLHQLRELWLRGNALERLPESVAGLTELRHLDLRDNALSEAPSHWPGSPFCADSICGATASRSCRTGSHLPSLEKLDLRWNDIEPSPRLIDDLERRRSWS